MMASNKIANTLSTFSTKRYFGLIVLTTLLIISYLIYRPGLNGLFRFDDFPNIIQNPYLAITSLDLQSIYLAGVSGGAGLLGRPISMVSFAANFFFTQFDPYYFKLTNLAIHLLNGVTVYFLALAIIKQDRFSNNYPDKTFFALMVCAAWLLLPIHVSGVLYVVQRMNLLSSLFVLLGLLTYVHFRTVDSDNAATKICIFTIIFLAAAAFSKENGILLLPLALLIELCFFKFKCRLKRNRQVLIAFFIITLLIPAILVGVKIFIKPEIITAPYALRTYSIEERLMTEARVLWFYIRQILVPNSQLFGFHLDDFEISQNLTSPISTLTAVIGIGVLLVASTIQLFRKQSMWAFCILFFLIGHSLESTLIGLEIAYEHRNYLPSIGLLFAVFYYFGRFRVNYRQPKSIYFLAIAYISCLTYLTYTRSADWGNTSVLKINELRNHPNSPRNHLETAYSLTYAKASNQDEAQENYQEAYHHFAKSADLNKAEIGGLVGLIELNSHYKLGIEPSWINAILFRISIFPISSSSATALETLYNCYHINKCQLTHNQIKAIFEAAESNPRVSEPTKLSVSILRANFLLHSENQTELANNEFIRISDLNSSSAQRLEIAKICVNNNLTDCVEKVLEKVKRAPDSIFYQPVIKELERATKLEK